MIGETASGERLRQYETVDLERALPERGFCELVPRLLTRRPLNQVRLDRGLLRSRKTKNSIELPKIGC